MRTNSGSTAWQKCFRVRLAPHDASAFAALWSPDVFYCPPIEYVIANKLRYFQVGRSDRHLRDVARMMEISGSEVDLPTLEHWIARLHLGTEWATARSYESRE